MTPVSQYKPLKHYQWGNHCDGWNLVDQSNMSVKLERMPPGTAESKHYHQFARQFFFILKGSATFETAEGNFIVPAQQGLEIPPQLQHRILNQGEEELEFLLCSQPSTGGDRIEVSGD